MRPGARLMRKCFNNAVLCILTCGWCMRLCFSKMRCFVLADALWISSMLAMLQCSYRYALCFNALSALRVNMRCMLMPNVN
jgi:hypothetical protein